MPLPALLAPLVATGTVLAKDQLLKQTTNFVSNLFGGGGNDGPNIARSLSKQVGFQVLQSDAALVRARLARGVDPRTGGPGKGPIAKPGSTARAGSLFSGITRTVAAVGLAKAGFDVNRPATGMPPPIRGGPTPADLGFPVPSPAVIRAPAQPRLPPPPALGGPASGGGGGGGMSLLPTVSGGFSLGSQLPRLIGGAGGAIRTQTGRIGRIILPSGARVSKRDAANLIRRLGFEAAAVALGITALEAAEIFLQESSRKRRGRGITAAQVRNARRTTCMVRNLARDLGVRAAPVRRKRTCRS